MPLSFYFLTASIGGVPNGRVINDVAAETRDLKFDIYIEAVRNL